MPIKYRLQVMPHLMKYLMGSTVKLMNDLLS